MKSFLLLSCLMAAVTDVTAGSGGGGESPTASTTPPSTPPPAADAEAEIVVPAPPKGADFDTVASMHQQLVNEGSPVAAAFHKKHVLGFKSK